MLVIAAYVLFDDNALALVEDLYDARPVIRASTSWRAKRQGTLMR